MEEVAQNPQRLQEVKSGCASSGDVIGGEILKKVCNLCTDGSRGKSMEVGSLCRDLQGCTPRQVVLYVSRGVYRHGFVCV